MSDSTSLLTQLTAGQAGKEITVNELMNAASPATTFGRRQSSSGLNWDWFGGDVMIDGVITSIANGTTALTASSANVFVEATRAGVVSMNTAGFTAGQTPLYQIVTGASTVTSYLDLRMTNVPATGRLALAMTDADTTLSAVQVRNNILEFTGTLTVQRNIVLPLAAQQWTVFNNTTGGFGLQFLGATGTGIIVAATKLAIVYSNGTNIVRVTADT